MATRDPRPPRRPVSALLALTVLVLALLGAAYVGAEALDRLRADTPAEAVAVGEPGCVPSAVFTGPDGVEREVDVTVYKANCLDRDPGESITVYYDADDPSVNASSRAWWWSALVAAAALALAVVAGRGLWGHLVAIRAERGAGAGSSG